MPDKLKSVTVSIMTPQGPVIVTLTAEDFQKLINRVNAVLGNPKKETPIPKVFEDAFSKEE